MQVATHLDFPAGLGCAGALVALALLGACAQPALKSTSADEMQITVQGASSPIVDLSSASLSSVCVQDVDGARTGDLDCLNQTLLRLVDRMHLPELPMDAVRSDGAGVMRGIAHEVAVRQRLGNTFGTSVQPQRPVPVDSGARARP